MTGVFLTRNPNCDPNGEEVKNHSSVLKSQHDTELMSSSTATEMAPYLYNTGTIPIYNGENPAIKGKDKGLYPFFFPWMMPFRQIDPCPRDRKVEAFLQASECFISGF